MSENTEQNNPEEVFAETIIDLEEYAKAGKTPTKAKGYKIKIDKNKYDVEQSQMTGGEILTLAGKTPPEAFQLNQKINETHIHVPLNETVDFTTPGIEKFMTIALDQGEG